jgi:tRNA(Arg) A34 adenosine deaminase TadA
MNYVVKNMLMLAARYAVKQVDRRDHRLGAVGLRADGALVHACNSPTQDRTPAAHAEARLSKKLTPKSVVFVARVRKSGDLALAKPCKRCLTRLRAAGVSKIFYTISNDSWECITP